MSLSFFTLRRACILCKNGPGDAIYNVTFQKTHKRTYHIFHHRLRLSVVHCKTKDNIYFAAAVRGYRPIVERLTQARNVSRERTEQISHINWKWHYTYARYGLCAATHIYIYTYICQSPRTKEVFPAKTPPLARPFAFASHTRISSQKHTHHYLKYVYTCDANNVCAPGTLQTFREMDDGRDLADVVAEANSIKIKI